MHDRKLNNIWCDDVGKPMKQTNFKVKNLGRMIPGETIHYIKLRFTIKNINS